MSTPQQDDEQPQKPRVMDALELLGLGGNNGDDDDDDDDGCSLDDDCAHSSGEGNTKKNKNEEEVLCANNYGTEADREFDTVIGAIENFLVSDELHSARSHFFSNLPPTASIVDQEKYGKFRQYIEMLDHLVDDYVKQQLPGKDISELAELLQSRKDEVSDDVMELVGGGGGDTGNGLDYESFVELWKVHEFSRNNNNNNNNRGDAAMIGKTSQLGDGLLVVSSPKKMEDKASAAAAAAASSEQFA